MTAAMVSIILFIILFACYLIFNSGISGSTSTSSSSLTIDSVPCLYFRKCGV